MNRGIALLRHIRERHANAFFPAWDPIGKLNERAILAEEIARHLWHETPYSRWRAADRIVRRNAIWFRWQDMMRANPAPERETHV